MSSESVEEGLILLKCYGCKTPTLFRLEILHEEESEQYIASTHCQRCERDAPLKGLVVRDLEPALVESQRIEPVCLEPDRGQGADS